MVGTRRHTAAAQSGLLLAVVEDDLAAVQRELAQPSPQWVAAEGGLSALHLAAGFASPAVLAAVLAAPSLPPGLLNAGLQANYTDPSVLHPLLDSAVSETRLAFRSGATSLHIAVYFGDADGVRALLCAGANCNIPDADGRTACHYATGAWMGSIGSGGQRQATPHPDIPALLLAAGVDIFSRTSNSRGVRSASPLAEVASAGADATASNVFLTRAAERHAAGQWAPPPDLPMVGLVQRAVQAGCKPFFAQFWSRGYYYNTAHQLYTLIQMGLTSAVQSLLSSGAASAAAHHYGQPMLSHAVLCREPASVQLLLQHGAPVTMGAVKAAVAGRGPQPAVLRMLLAGGPAFARTTHQYWHCPVFAVLDGSCKRKWLVNPEGDVAYYRDAMVCMELMAEAGIDSYMKRDNGEVHFSPHPHYMKHHPRSSALWRAYCERATWTPTTHQQFLPSFQDAVRALLLAAHRASHQPGRGTAAGLGALPQDVLLHIVSLAAYPSSAWV